MEKIKIFLVEDDTTFGSVLVAYLEVNDYQVVWVEDGRDAIREFRNGVYDICILDVMLPNVDGFTIAKEIKKSDQHIPLIFLTAKSLKKDILQGFKIGADDYITKPFDSEVLIYKIKAILHRKGEINYTDDIEAYKIGNYLFNYKLRTITCNQKQQKLSPKEADLLHLLYEHKNDVLIRQVALERIWGDSNYFTTRSMDVFVSKLRKYLKDDPDVQIENLHGSGFRLLIRNDE